MHTTPMTQFDGKHQSLISGQTNEGRALTTSSIIAVEQGGTDVQGAISPLTWLRVDTAHLPTSYRVKNQRMNRPHRSI